MGYCKAKDDIMKKVAQDWSDRDALPKRDPIGDIDPQVAVTVASFKKDEQTYTEMMRERLLNPKGKVFGHVHHGIDISKNGYYSSEEPKCNCGIAKTYKNPTLRMHSTWCELRKNDC